MSKTYNRDYFLDRKLKYEKNHGNFIHEFMFNEYQTRILGQCNVALNDLQRQLDLEIARAKAEEARLDQKIDAETARATAEETRLDGKIDAETSRAKGRENELSTSINACLPKAGGDMEDESLITWSNGSDNPNPNPIPFTEGGLIWRGATDYVSIRGVINQGDNINLVVNMGDDNSNAVVFTNAEQHEVASIHSNGVYTGSIDWSHINNRPELNNADAYTYDEEHGQLVKNKEQTDLISSYNNTLMNIARLINVMSRAIHNLEGNGHVE